MKQTYFLLFFISVSTTSFAQSVSKHDATNEFLNWLVKRNHIELLNAETDLSTFYGTGSDVLKIKDLLNDSTNTTSDKKCLKDFMTDKEAEIFHLKFNKSKQIKWENTHYILPVTYYKDIPHVIQNKNTNSRKTFYGLSYPIFLNKEQTRVLIGEYFIIDVAFGRGDVLLCEYRNGEWRIIARAVTWNN